MKISFPITEAEIKIKDKFVSCYTDTEDNLFFSHAQIKKMLNSDIPAESLIRIYYDNYSALEDKSVCVKNAYDILYNEHGTCIMVSLVYKEHEFKETMYLYKRIMNTLVCNENKQLIGEFCFNFNMGISDVFNSINQYNESKIGQNISIFPPFKDKSELFNALPEMYKKSCEYLSQQVLVTSLYEIPFDKKLFPITGNRRVDMNKHESKKISTFANQFEISGQELIDILKDGGILYEDNRSKQEYIDDGYFETGYQNIDNSSEELDIKVFPDPDQLFDNNFHNQLVYRTDVLDKVKPLPIDEGSYCVNISTTAHERGISLEDAELMLRSRGLRITYPNDKADRWLFRKPEANN